MSGEAHSHSPTGNHHSTTSSSSSSSSHKHVHRHVEIPAASSPVTRYKRASSPTIGFPTDSRQHFVLDNHAHHMAQHHGDGQRSHSPDLAGGRGREGYPSSSSYNPPAWPRLGIAGSRICRNFRLNSNNSNNSSNNSNIISNSSNVSQEAYHLGACRLPTTST